MRLRRWLAPGAFALGGLVPLLRILTGNAADAPSLLVAVVTMVTFFAAAVFLAPVQRLRSGTQAEAVEAAAHGEVVVYYRDGCTYCQRIMIALGSDKNQALWVDVWADEAASAYVKSVNNGNEIVPTVMIDGEPHTNPAPSVVSEALAARQGTD